MTKSYFGTHDFSNASVVGIGGGGSVAASGAVFAETYTPIDLAATGIHSIYTVPGSTTTVCYGVVFAAVTATAVSGTLSVSVGSNATDHDNVVADQQLIQFGTTANDGYKIIDFGRFVQTTAGNTISVKVNTPASGTLTSHVYLLGFNR